MKKLIYFLMFVLLASLTLAFLPQPLAGTVTMEGLPVPEGLSLTQTNLRTGMEVPIKVDSNGFFLVDWSNHPFFDGDKIEVSIDVCKSRPECKKVITLVEGVPNLISELAFEISPGGADEPDTVYETIKETIYIYVCWDGSEKAAASQCPAQPPEKSGELWQIILTGIIALGAGGAGGFFAFKNRAMSKGVGIKIYKGRDGTEKVLHKHPAVRGYHSPYIQHRPASERHSKGQLNPLYEKDLDGDYMYVS